MDFKQILDRVERRILLHDGREFSSERGYDVPLIRHGPLFTILHRYNPKESVVISEYDISKDEYRVKTSNMWFNSLADLIENRHDIITEE